MIVINFFTRLIDTKPAAELIKKSFDVGIEHVPQLTTKKLNHFIEIEKIKYLIELIEPVKYYITAVENNQLLGFAILSDSNLHNFYDLTWVCVEPAYRNKGIGKEIVKKAIEFSQQKNKNIVITTERTKFYTELGFNICSEFKSGWYLMATTIKENI